ncbi:hypothetical protein CSC73_15725 [Pseudoxanthomonas sacheonensis]|nr:hypothetical protein CSC73_15725 [Pseudoxanthomonas sacheonensis]
MRIALFAIALAAAVPACAQTISENFDRISGERTVAYTADGSMDTSMPVFTFEAILVGDTSSSTITLAFVSAEEGSGASASRFSACHDIDWRVDGQPLSAGPTSYRGKVVDGEMIELIGQNVTPQWASAVGSAQDVRYRVCRNEYTLTNNDIEAFGRIAAKLKGATLPPSMTRADAPAAAPAKGVEYKGMNWRPKHPGSF